MRICLDYIDKKQKKFWFSICKEPNEIYTVSFGPEDFEDLETEDFLNKICDKVDQFLTDHPDYEAVSDIYFIE